MGPELLKYSIEVGEAIGEGLPVVALESTIITHGMPYPVNVETALGVEATIRSEGCVPATIAIMDGRIKIGLSSDEISYLGRLDREEVAKVSSADIAYVVAKGQIGSTTVSGTTLCARMAGISILATGGIGGVHRGGEASMDVSADIYEMVRANMTVVCAGVKSILDIGRTLELLESYGVPVIGYQTKEFPAFYCRSSGFPLRSELGSPAEVANYIMTTQKLGLSKGMILACPVPVNDALERSQLDNFIRQALRQAESKKVRGKEVTPFLLESVASLSKGKSLASNVALIKNNAKIAAQVARSLMSQNNMVSPRGFEPLLPP